MPRPRCAGWACSDRALPPPGSRRGRQAAQSARTATCAAAPSHFAAAHCAWSAPAACAAGSSTARRRLTVDDWLGAARMLMTAQCTVFTDPADHRAAL
jgi:hypothetical protein